MEDYLIVIENGYINSNGLLRLLMILLMGLLMESNSLVHLNIHDHGESSMIHTVSPTSVFFLYIHGKGLIPEYQSI